MKVKASELIGPAAGFAEGALTMRRQITKAQFYRNGGFANPHQYRRMIDRAWCYFEWE